MKQIEGLTEYIKKPQYRLALSLPEEATEEYLPLAQGEYNINYLFSHPVNGQKLVLRVNCGSQMHLEKQIEYEYKALKFLEASGRTPKVFYVDGSKDEIDKGVLVMEYLPGQALNYKKDMKLAAECLADIHALTIGDFAPELIFPGNPLAAILQECEEMFSHYEQSPWADSDKKRQIRQMLNFGWQAVRSNHCQGDYLCCINTELNSGNFLVDRAAETCYLVDWEKPILGDPAQDLGHFLAPTTTFWKTDVILTMAEIESFINLYIQAVDGRFPTDGLKDRVMLYLPVTCLRGVTWCSMAWVQYRQKGKELCNRDTAAKLDAYLSQKYLDYIENFLRRNLR